MKPVVGIIMGSDSDLPVMSETAKILEKFEIPFEVKIISAHRTPDRIFEYARGAKANGLKVIIAGAGGAAHLAGVTAALTPLPVIGVPIKSAALNGLDSLYSIVQMPSGIPVATTAINGALNAGLLAVKMLALSDEKLSDKLVAYQEELKNSVEKKAEKLENIGYKAYLESK